MKKILKIVVIVLAVIFVGAQFIRPNQTNPPIDPSGTLEASTAVPDNVETILKRSCVDCHTNTTVYPWYAQISPFSWFLNNHFRDGPNELNFSVWNTYETRRKVRKLDELCEQVKSGEMPLPSYLWIHRDAGLREGDAEILCGWADQTKSSLR